MTENIVVYHSNCNDGFASAWAAWKKFGDENTKYIPMQYGEKLELQPRDKDTLVKIFILDFSFGP